MPSQPAGIYCLYYFLIHNKNQRPQIVREVNVYNLFLHPLLEGLEDDEENGDDEE